MVAPGSTVTPAAGSYRPPARRGAPAPAKAAFIPYRQQLRTAALDHRDGPTYALYPYQTEAASKVLDGWQRGRSLDALVSLPTGTGKTEVAIQVMASFRKGQRILILTHRRQLVEQMAGRICLRYPAWASEVGTLVGGEGDLDRPITVCTIQSLVGARGSRLARLDTLLEHGLTDLVIVDEAHHSAASSYRTVIKYLRDRNPSLRHLGLTATPILSGKTSLSEIYDLVEYKPVTWAVSAGYLVPPVGIKVTTDVDLSGVRTANGDFVDEALGAALNTPGFNRLAVRLYQTYLRGSRTLVFCASCAHARAVYETFQAAGIKSSLVIARTKDDERHAAQDALISGEIPVLINVGVYSEGSDIPCVESLMNLRLTRSPILYTQIVGRALRLAPGKSRATIIDLTTSDQTLFTLDDLMEGAFIQEEVEVKLGGKERTPHAPRLVARPSRPGVDPTEYTTHLVDLLGATELAWYSNAGRSVMPLQAGYALLLTPGGEGARAYLESQLALARADKTQAVAEQVEWQLAHHDQCVLFHVNGPTATPVDWDKDYGTLVGVASTWASQRKSPSLSLRSSKWRERPPSPDQLRRLIGDGVIPSAEYLAHQETLAGAKLSMGLASCLISFVEAVQKLKGAGFVLPPPPVANTEERDVRFRRLLLEQGMRTGGKVDLVQRTGRTDRLEDETEPDAD